MRRPFNNDRAFGRFVGLYVIITFITRWLLVVRVSPGLAGRRATSTRCSTHLSERPRQGGGDRAAERAGGRLRRRGRARHDDTAPKRLSNVALSGQSDNFLEKSGGLVILRSGWRERRRHIHRWRRDERNPIRIEEPRPEVRNLWRVGETSGRGIGRSGG